MIDFYKYAEDFGELLEKRTGRKYRIEIIYNVAYYYIDDRRQIHLWNPQPDEISFYIYGYRLAYSFMKMDDNISMSVVDLDKDVDLVLNTLRKLIEKQVCIITSKYEEEMIKIEIDLQLLS